VVHYKGGLRGGLITGVGWPSALITGVVSLWGGLITGVATLQGLLQGIPQNHIGQNCIATASAEAHNPEIL
jgi:hypothetical protein